MMIVMLILSIMYLFKIKHVCSELFTLANLMKILKQK